MENRVRKFLVGLLVAMLSLTCSSKQLVGQSERISDAEVVGEEQQVVTSHEIVESKEPIFDSEDEMLLALQGSWLWDKARIEREPYYSDWYHDGHQFVKPYFGRHPQEGFSISYLIGPISVLENSWSYIMDLDMTKLEIDLDKNTLSIGSYYSDDYRLIFHFIAKDQLYMQEIGGLPHLGSYLVYEGEDFYDESGKLDLAHGEAVSSIYWGWDGFVDVNKFRVERAEETKARLDAAGGRNFSFFDNWENNPVENRYVFVRVDGFEHDEAYNVYDKEGNFLMNPQMIRENREAALPTYSTLQNK